MAVVSWRIAHLKGKWGKSSGTGVDMEAMVSTDTRVPVTETGFSLNIDEGTPFTDGEEYTFEFAMVDSAGQPVTVTHTARWQSE